MQIKNTAVIFLVILVGIPLATCLHLWMSGEFQACTLTACVGLLDALNHSVFTSAMTAFGWLFMRSPLSGKITEILQTSTSPSGVKKETAVTITEPAEAKK